MTPVSIVDGRTLSPPCWWQPPAPGCRRRVGLPTQWVWHWTGGTRPAEGVAATLRARRLSVHYVIDPDGRVVQMADPIATVTYHAGAANAESIGVEIVGGPAHDFTAAQYAAILALADAAPPSIPRVIFERGRDTLATFAGHLEHLDVSRTKIDAGGRVLAALRAHWSPA